MAHDWPATLTGAGDQAVRRAFHIVADGPGQGTVFGEAARIQQRIDLLPRGPMAGLAPFCHGFRPGRIQGGGAQSADAINIFTHILLFLNLL